MEWGGWMARSPSSRARGVASDRKPRARLLAKGRSSASLDRNATSRRGRPCSEIGDRAFPLVTDVTDEASVAAAFDEVRRRHGRLDVLYNCAAVQLIGEDAPVHELDIDVWQRTHDVNLRGVYLTSKHGVRLMMESGDGGSIINAGSPTGLTMCGAGWHAYSSSKAGVMGLTRVMAADYAPYGIRVNGIVPGSIETTLTKPLMDDPEIRPSSWRCTRSAASARRKTWRESPSSWLQMNRRSPPAPISTSMAVSRFAESEGYERDVSRRRHARFHSSQR